VNASINRIEESSRGALPPRSLQGNQVSKNATQRRRGYSTKVAAIRLLICLLGLWPSSAAAVDLRNIITDYAVTSWTQKDGLPPAVIRAIVQDKENYLWIGTDNGLFRFDGMRFTPVIEHAVVRALCQGRDNTLWIGLGGSGGVAHASLGLIRNYDQRDGLPNSVVNALVEDADAVLWAGTADGLFQFESGHWSHWAAGLPPGEVYGAFVDASNDLLVGMAEGTFRRQPHADHFELLEPSSESRLAARLVSQERQPRSFAQDSSGQLWESDRISGFRRLHDHDANSSPLSGRGYALLFDDKENLWVATIGQGLWRVQRNNTHSLEAVERVTSLTGLPSDGVFCLFEDRDGNIWVGTDDGLSRLSLRRVTQLTNFGIVVGLGVTATGDVWVGAVDELIRFASGNRDALVRIPLTTGRLKAMYVEPGGTVWAATEKQIVRCQGPSCHMIPVQGTEGLSQVGALTSDGRGGLVIADGTRGLMRWNAGRLTPLLSKPPDRIDRSIVLHTDREDRIWVAFGDGKLIVVNPDGSERWFGPKDGLTAGVIRQIYEHDNGELWLAANDGLLKYSSGRFVPVNFGKSVPLHDVTALIFDRGQSVWVGTNFGIVRIDSANHAAATQGTDKYSYTVYDRADGLAGSPLPYTSNLRVIRGPGNLLWFVTARGVSIIDPAALPPSRTAGPIWIESVVVDDRSMATTPGLRLPARTSRINIRYTVVDLAAPFRTRFRYRLEGFDADWIDANARREVFYTNLPPRDYRFRVSASTSQGLWEGPETSWAFSVAPRFYQTSWFYATAVGLFLLLIWGAWQIRLTAVRRNFAILLHERARLSREIHDTLLQSLVGVSLQFDVIANDEQPLSEASRTRFGRMRKQMEEHIREARQSILQLRSSKLERSSLVAALRDVGQQTASETAVDFNLTVKGESYPLPRKIELQIFRIGQEAILNAFRHSKGSSITANVEYSRDNLTLLIEDDGIGFDAPAAGPQNSHYGIVSMRERAAEIRGELTMVSQPERGTSVRLSVPVLRWKRRQHAE
jgi:signal transduction histidine kinase/ligand-binding sensor domain-containing protein